MLYQFENSMRGDTLKIERGANIKFPKHLHNSFEFLLVTEGKMYIDVENNCYEIDAGDALLIFPNQVHEFKETVNSTHFLCIFSTDLVASYSNIFGGSVPRSNQFTPRNDYVSILSSACKKNIFTVQGALYSLCGEFHEDAVYMEKAEKDNTLIEKIFNFVEANFQKDCTLAALSRYTSYSYVYLSRYFKKYTGISFIEYVNCCRVNEACYVLKNSSKTILSIAIECGFNSLRNFNAVFKRITGKTPGEYRMSAISQNSKSPTLLDR